MIQFVANYEDMSTDKGYQFKFFCDKCRNGYMSRWVTSKSGLAGSVLRTAGSVFGGLLGSASHSSYELQRMIGGPEAPDFQEQLAASHAQAKTDAARDQWQERARRTDYSSGVDLSADATPRASDADVHNAKFCPQYGSKAAPGTKFCAECGNRLTPA